MADGEQPLAVHALALAPDEGVLTALVAGRARLDRPRLPAWLGPVQLRLVPIGSEHIPHCESLAAEFAAAGIRVDIDDREKPVSERLRAAERNWVPYDVVVGDEETEGETLRVTVREEHAQRTLTSGELRDRICAELEGWPYSPLPFARRHTERPPFLGVE